MLKAVPPPDGKGAEVRGEASSKHVAPRLLPLAPSFAISRQWFRPEALPHISVYLTCSRSFSGIPGERHGFPR